MNSASTIYATGERVRWDQILPAPPGASRAAQIRAEWPMLCRSVNCFRPDPDDKTYGYIPALLDYRADGHLQYFDVALTAMFVAAGDTSPPAVLPERLMTAVRGFSVAHRELDDPPTELRPKAHQRMVELFGEGVSVLRIVVSAFKLPKMLDFDPTKISDNPHQFYLGQLSEGSDAIWDTNANPHAVIAGSTGSGKSKAADLILPQAHLKGWDIHAYTAKAADSIFAPYTDLGHTVFTGVRQASVVEDLNRVRDDLQSIRDEIDRRQDIRGRHGVEWWHQVPDKDRDGPPILVCFDETRSFFPVKARKESPEVVQARAEVAAEVENIAQLARSENIILLMMTQSPYVEALAGGYTMDQINFWLVVKRLSKKWLPSVYGETLSENPAKLVNGTLPAGRGVIRGALAPDNAFGDDAVDDGLVQVAWMSPEMRADLLAGNSTLRVVEDPEPDTDVFDLPEDAATPVVVGSTPDTTPAGPADQFATGPRVELHTLALAAPAVALLAVLAFLIGGLPS